jgi:salicylate hydroxylase
MHVVVVGGGIGGLCAAVSLMARGIDVTVLEGARALQPIGAGIQVAPNACRVLANLDLLDEVRHRSVAPEAILVRSHRRGRVLHTTTLGNAVVDEYGFPYLHVHRADLVEVLAAALPDDTIRLGSRVTGVDDDRERCRITTEDGSVVEADAVIGADGIHSAVRELLFGADEPTFSGYVCWRGLVPADRLTDWNLPRVCEAYYGPNCSAVSYYVSSGELYNFVGIVPADDQWRSEDWTAQGDPADLRRDFADFHAPVRAVAAEIEQPLKWAIYDRDPLDAWSVGRVTLLGDAAHAMLPYLAQGACQAIEDAAVVARCLERWPDRPEHALAVYEAVRRPHTTRVQHAARRGETTFHLSDWREVWRRNHALRDAQVRGTVGSPTGWLYGHDALTEPLRPST